MRFVYLGPGLCLRLPSHGHLVVLLTDTSRCRTCRWARDPVTWTPEDLHLLVASRWVFTSWLPAPRGPGRHACRTSGPLADARGSKAEQRLNPGGVVTTVHTFSARRGSTCARGSERAQKGDQRRQ